MDHSTCAVRVGLIFLEYCPPACPAVTPHEGGTSQKWGGTVKKISQIVLPHFQNRSGAYASGMLDLHTVKPNSLLRNETDTC